MCISHIKIYFLSIAAGYLIVIPAINDEKIEANNSAVQWFNDPSITLHRTMPVISLAGNMTKCDWLN